jgi:hypothetical protein
MGRWRDTGPPRECILCIVSHSKTKKGKKEGRHLKVISGQRKKERERERERIFCFCWNTILAAELCVFFYDFIQKTGSFLKLPRVSQPRSGSCHFHRRKCSSLFLLSVPGRWSRSRGNFVSCWHQIDDARTL